VVAPNHNEVAAVRKFHELRVATPRIRAQFNDVAQHDDRVVGLRIDGLDERLQGRGTAVDVTNREDAGGNGVVALNSVGNRLIAESVGSLVHKRSARGPVADYDEQQFGADSIGDRHGRVSNRLSPSNLPSSLSHEEPAIDEHQTIEGRGKRQRRHAPPGCELEPRRYPPALVTVGAESVS
jgi:hypothetical protein